MRRGIAAAMSAVMMLTVCGCSGNTPDTPSDTTASGGDSAVVEEVKFLDEDYYRSNYVPDPKLWGGPAVEITGSVGQETEAKIPSVFITCESEIDRDLYSDCVIEIDSTMTEALPSTVPLAATIRGRGHSTWDWPKKPYKLKLNEKESLLGMEASKNWALIANYADESLLRNATAFAMADYLGSFAFTPQSVSVNLYLNGIYQGVYTLTELIESKKSRFDLDYRDDSTNTGYLLEVGGADPLTDVKGVNCFDLPSGCAKDILLKAPEGDKLKQEQYDYIYKYLVMTDEAITTLTDYEKYIDVNSFIDWFLLHELSYNLDSCFHRSCFMYKDRGGKLKMGPVWDFDLAFGNLYNDNPNYDDWATVGSSNSNSYIGVNWFNYLMADENFRTKARARWDEVKDGLVEAAYIAIDAEKALIYPSAADNFAVWDTLEIANGFQPKSMESYTTYNEQVAYVRRFITKRAEWIDNNL